MNEVDEGVPNITLSLQVHRQVKVVILAFVVLVDHNKQLHLLELVGDVSDHNGSSFFFVRYDLCKFDFIFDLVALLLFFFRGFPFELGFLRLFLLRSVALSREGKGVRLLSL